MTRVLQPLGRFIASGPNFLRGAGLMRPYHRLMSGPKRSILNLYSLLKKIITSRLSPQEMCFEFIQPRPSPDGRGGDEDAVCVTNPIDIKFLLRRMHVEIVRVRTSLPSQTFLGPSGRVATNQKYIKFQFHHRNEEAPRHQ